MLNKLLKTIKHGLPEGDYKHNEKEDTWELTDKSYNLLVYNFGFLEIKQNYHPYYFYAGNRKISMWFSFDSSECFYAYGEGENEEVRYWEEVEK